jgi:hypothetical protein
MFSRLFRQQQLAAPQQVPFKLPDHLQAVQVREPEPVSQAKLTAADEVAFDEYISSTKLAKTYTDRSEKAKDHLKKALGDATSGVLPDGRLITQQKSWTEPTVINRKGFWSTKIQGA